MTQPEKIVFAIVGAGWRSEFFLRIARALPERFEVCGVVARREETRRQLAGEWGVETYGSLEELLRSQHPAFAVVSLPRTVAPDYIRLAAANGLPVLTETPPADTVEQLVELNALVADGATIQVAEQYHLQPMVRAQLDLARSGLLGAVSQAQVSLCHDYHGISLIRRFLGIGYEEATVTAHEFVSPMVQGPSRAGDPTEEKIVSSTQLIARLEFRGPSGDEGHSHRLGIYDFAGEQYRGWIRSPRVHVRGHRGEITNERVNYLEDFRTPIGYDIERVEGAEHTRLEAHFLRGMRAGSRWVYRNDFAPARLSDDELALAECLVRMHAHVGGGPDLYSLAEASQDHYLQLLMHESAASGGTPVSATRQPWAP